MKRIRFSVMLFILLPCLLSFAQEKAFTLPDVSISAPSNIIQKEKKVKDDTPLLDSSQFANGLNSLTSLLSYKSSVYIKNYGPGNMASIALRGTSAAHTAIVWKGIPINNSMVGMIDLNHINGSVLTGSRLQEGGKTQMAVTENFGGIIVLGEGLKQNGMGEKATIGLRLGNFSTFQHHASVQTNLRKAHIKLSIWNLSALNNFRYEREGIEKRQNHASRQNRGLEGNIIIPIFKNLELESAMWTQENDSEIPPSIYQSKSEAKQKDENLRISNRLNWDLKTVQIHVGQGIMKDFLHYQNPVSEIDSKSKVFNHLAWIELKKDANNWHFSGNLWSSIAQAETKNYKQSPEANRLAFNGNLSHQFIKLPIQIVGQMRIERFQYSDTKINGYAFLPSLSADWNIERSGSVKVGIHRKMRLPTLNDLYWNPNGNQKLKAETGWTSDLSWKVEKHLSHSILLESDWQLFCSQIHNYIQWLPVGNNWKPTNIAEIQILGGGISEKISWKKNDIQYYTAFNLQFTRSVNAKTRFSGDESKGKQLIYIPLWQNHIAIGFKKRNLEGQCSSHFTDRRFLDPTNSLWLNGFVTINARLSYALTFDKNSRLSIFGEGLNLTKTNYQMVAGFAMPGRQYSAGIQLQFL